MPRKCTRIVRPCDVCGKEMVTVGRDAAKKKYCSNKCIGVLHSRNAARPEERFWAKVDKGGECWNWTASKTEGGYGQFVLGSQTDGTRRHELAHRFSYRTQVGEIPEGMLVCHTCDNRACVRPDHFFLGTQRDNMDDMVEKGRQPRGSASHNHILTEAEVLEIRAKYIPYEVSVPALAKEYNVHKSTVREIIKRINWKYI